MSSALLRSEAFRCLRFVCGADRADRLRPKIGMLAVMFLLGFTAQTISSPLGIVVHQSQHQLEFEFWRNVPPFDPPGTNIQVTHQSPSPVGVIINTNPFTGTAAVFAEATSEAFAVSAFAPELYPNDPLMASIRVSATSEVEFSPVTSTTAMLSILFSGTGHWFDSSSGSLTLVDLTTATELLNLGWYYQSEAFLGGPPPPPASAWSGSVGLTNIFDFGHTYKLRMHTEVWANNSPRSPAIHLHLAGLEPTPAIPEPSSLAIVMLGVILGRQPRNWPGGNARNTR